MKGEQEASGISRLHLVLAALFWVALAWSALKPHDYFTWALEVAPAVLGFLVLAALYPRFRFSDLLCFIFLVHAVILLAGGRYTYALNPLFDWIKQAWGLERNYYDRLGHFLQGFTPALVVREVFLRRDVFNDKRWLPLVAIAVSLALSACYEFVEWWVALATGEAADAFLGAQGDVWDTQWDMFMALCGAMTALVFMPGLHDKSMSILLAPRGADARPTLH